MSLSMSGVGVSTAPYSECTVTPVFSSMPLLIFSPALASPRMPCSGPYSAVSFTPGALNSRSMVLVPFRSRPEWLVSRPTRFPLMRCSESVSSTSMPGITLPVRGGVGRACEWSDVSGRERVSAQSAVAAIVANIVASCRCVERFITDGEGR